LDVWDLKGQFEAAVALAIPQGAVQVEGSEWTARDSNGRTVGWAGPVAADAPPWAAPLFGFELLLDPAPRLPARFVTLPSTPSSERVLALLLGEGTTVRQVEELLERMGGELVESILVESDYRGPELPPGRRSVAFRLTFRAADRTLRDPEMDAIEARLLTALATELDIQRRDAGGPRGGA
jgi:phenylalanyl-tRNA synthetase beta subunit